MRTLDEKFIANDHRVRGDAPAGRLHRRGRRAAARPTDRSTANSSGRIIAAASPADPGAAATADAIAARPDDARLGSGRATRPRLSRSLPRRGDRRRRPRRGALRTAERRDAARPSALGLPHRRIGRRRGRHRRPRAPRLRRRDLRHEGLRRDSSPTDPYDPGEVDDAPPPTRAPRNGAGILVAAGRSWWAAQDDLAAAWREYWRKPFRKRLSAMGRTDAAPDPES